jgi:DNA-binding NarL/FixJ family response regulator
MVVSEQNRGEAPIRVLLADDHVLFRKGMAKLLDSDTRISVIGECGDGREVLRKAEQLRPDVLVLDLKLPRLSGIDVARELRERFPKMRVLIVTGIDADNYLTEALEAGASGYLLKESEPEAVMAAILAVVEDLFVVTAPAARRTFGALTSGSVRRESFGGMTARELEVLKLTAQGLANKQVARALGLSDKTVRNHIANIYEKLGIHDRSQALLYAVRKGLIDPSVTQPEEGPDVTP